jgi:glyoxylase-like metal-dependent hydrolase (beta-lactamase superfamily II)
VKLTSNLFYYPWTDFSINNCNTYLIGNQSFILVDPGLDLCLPVVFDEMRKDGIDPDAIQFVITTHSHPDHFEGVRSFVNKGVKIALHPDEDAFLRQHGNDFYRMFGITLPTYQSDADFGEGAREVNGTAMDIYHTPGHSPGSISIYLPDSKALIAGDVIFQAGVGRTDFPGGNGRLLKKSIDRLAELDTAYLLPGHGDLVIGRDRVKRNFEYVADVYYGMI